VVDECQNLDLTALEELRMLSNFQLGSHPLLQSLLLGQPEFRRTLAQHPDLDQLRQRIIASHHLDALGEEEVEAYVTHRLGHVGWESRPELADGLLKQLYAATGGVPRRVNQVMNRLLLLGAIEEAGELTPAMLDSVLEEMRADQQKGAREGATNAARSVAPKMEPEQAPVNEQRPIDAVPATEVAALLAERDARTTRLEAAIGELQAVTAPAGAAQRTFDPELAARIEQIEKRLDEQEQSLRHVLTMLIEWLESDLSREAA
jgi:hypothetical protein